MKSAMLAILALGLSAPETSAEKLLKEAKLSLSEAIEKAGLADKDVSPVWIRLKEEKGRVLHVVRCAQGEESLKISLDAKTGDVVEKVSTKKSHAKTIAAAKTSLPKAVAIALKKVPGKALKADIEMENGKAVIEVKIFHEGKMWEVEVDADSGVVLEVEEDDDDDDDDDDEADGDDD